MQDEAADYQCQTQLDWDGDLAKTLLDNGAGVDLRQIIGNTGVIDNAAGGDKAETCNNRDRTEAYTVDQVYALFVSGVIRLPPPRVVTIHII